MEISSSPNITPRTRYIVTSIIIILSFIATTTISQDGDCDCFDIKLDSYDETGCYTYFISKDKSQPCQQTPNQIVLATCPDNDIEEELFSISPHRNIKEVIIDDTQQTGLQIDIDLTNTNNDTFTLCFDAVNHNGTVSDIAFVNGQQCEFQDGLPCFGLVLFIFPSQITSKIRKCFCISLAFRVVVTGHIFLINTFILLQKIFR